MQGLKECVKVADTDFLAIYEKAILSHTQADDNILVPYMSIGDFAFEAAINERKCLVYDNNPLIKINFESEFFYPSLAGIRARFKEIRMIKNHPDCGVKRFFNSQLYDEVMSIRTFLDSAPRDAINLWIRRLVAETLRMPAQNKILEYFVAKEMTLRLYKSVLSSIDPMKILILHYYIPSFFENETAAESVLKGSKVKMVHYAPYTFDADSYFEHNFLKMWFSGISREQLEGALVNDLDCANRSKKDFVTLHKKLEGGGLLLVEKARDYDLEAFLKLALFYGYENIKSFASLKKEVYLMRKSSL